MALQIADENGLTSSILNWYFKSLELAFKQEMQVSIIRAIDRALKTFAIEVSTRLTPITSKHRRSVSLAHIRTTYIS